MSFLTRLLLTVILCSGLSQQDPSCSLARTKEVQAEFTECTTTFNDKFYSAAEEGDVCTLLRDIVDTCVQIFGQCHSLRDVRRMKDLHIENLIKQHQDHGELDLCPVVKEYRESGREFEAEDEVLCTDERTNVVNAEYQECSHSSAIVVYQGIIEMTDPNLDIIAEKMCKSLSKIGTVCVKPLSECYAIDDLKQIRKSYILEAKKYLLSFKQDMGADALDNCKILDYTENLDEETPLSDSLDIVSDDQEEVTETAETTVTDDPVTTERIQAKPSRSAELDSQEDLDTYDYAEYYEQYGISAEKFNHDDDDDYATDDAINNAVHKDNSDGNSDGGEDASTEAVERLHYRQPSSSSSSRSRVIHSVIMLVPSLLFFIYFL